MASQLELNIPDLEIMPNHSIGQEELICELRKTPSVLYGIFVEVARKVYISGQGYLKGVPNIMWDEDPNKTGIWIDSELNWRDDVPEFRPAIFVRLGEQQTSSPSNINKPSALDVVDAIYTYERFVSGTVSFVHVAERAGEALILADNTEAVLNDFAAQIKTDFCFTHFVPASRVPLAQVQPESSPRYSSIVTYRYDFGESWSLKLESPKLKTLQVKYSGVFDGQQYRGHGSISKNVTPPAL